MFEHIKPSLTTAELREADKLLAQGWDPGWIDRRILAQMRNPDDNLRAQLDRDGTIPRARRTKRRKKAVPVRDAAVKASLANRWGTSDFTESQLRAERDAIASRRLLTAKRNSQLLAGDYN